MKVIFGLNAIVGRTKQEPYWNYTGRWDSTETKQLLSEWSNEAYKEMSTH